MNIRVFGTDGRLAALNDSKTALQAKAHANSNWCYFWFHTLLICLVTGLTVSYTGSDLARIIPLVISLVGLIVKLLCEILEYRFSIQYGAVSALREIRKILRTKMEDDKCRDACDDLVRRGVVELLYCENKYGKNSSSAKRQREKALTIFTILREIGAVKKPYESYFSLRS